jgi:hypothetical protein
MGAGQKWELGRSGSRAEVGAVQKWEPDRVWVGGGGRETVCEDEERKEEEEVRGQERFIYPNFWWPEKVSPGSSCGDRTHRRSQLTGS